MNSNIFGKIDFDNINIDDHHIIIKFRSFFNVVWGTKIKGREALAFVKGFPGLMLVTDRRIIILAQYLEKQGWFKKKQFHTLTFEVGLHNLIKKEIIINPRLKQFTGYLKFSPHGIVGDTIIQFIKLDPKIGLALEKHLDNLKIQHPLEDTGIVNIDIDPIKWVNSRLKK